MSLGPDSIIASRYKLLHKLGEGGFAIVFKAQDLELGRTVAIKFLKADGQDSESLERFLREARLIARLSHPNVVSVYAIDVLENENMPYIVMEFLDGESLASRVSRLGPFFDGECMKLCLALCDGLNQLHENNILHRDLSSNNIFLCKLAADDSFDPKIIDLGLSKVLADNSSVADKKLTATGLLIGNPAFMSPEQARAEALDKRSDIYSLGCVFYTAVYGRAPFEADTPVALLYKHQNEEPSFPVLKWRDQKAATRVINTLRIAMQKSASNRFQSCTEFAAALRGESRLPSKNKSNLAWRLAALSGVLVVGFLSMYVFSIKKKSAELPQPAGHKISRKSSLSLSMRKPESFFELLDVVEDFVRQKHPKEALELLDSFKGNLNAREKQLLNMRKLSLSAALGMKHEEDRLAAKLYSDPTVIENHSVLISLIDYYVTRDPSKCLELCKLWQKKNPGERDFIVELCNVRALVLTRKFSEAEKLFPSFDSFGISQSPDPVNVVSQLEQIKLVARIGMNQSIDVVKACDALTDVLPRRRISDRYHNYIEVADLLENAGLIEPAAKLWFAAAHGCKKSDLDKSVSCFYRICSGPFYRDNPELVIESAKELLASRHPHVNTFEIRHVLFEMYIVLNKMDEAKRVAMESYETFENTYSSKSQWIAEDLKGLLTCETDVWLISMSQRANEDCRRVCHRVLELVKGRKEAPIVTAATFCFLAHDAEAVCDHAALIRYSKIAADDLENISQPQLSETFAKLLSPFLTMCANLPPRDAVYCLDKIQRAYKRAYPARSQPLALLALLSTAYSAMPSSESVIKIFPDFMNSLEEYDFANSNELPVDMLSLIRFFSNTIDSAEIKSAVSKIGSKNPSAENLAVRSLALSEYFLDRRQSAEFAQSFTTFRAQLFDLKKWNKYAYEILRRDAIILSLRSGEKSAPALISQLVSDINERGRIQLFVELSGYFERFRDYGIWANFLRQNEALLKDSTNYNVSTLIRVEGDCFHSCGDNVQSEQVFAAALADYLARKHLTEADVGNDLDLALLYWGTVRAKMALGKNDIPLRVFKTLAPALSKFKFAQKIGLKKFVDFWQAAAKNGNPGDLKEVEDFRRIML